MINCLFFKRSGSFSVVTRLENLHYKCNCSNFVYFSDERNVWLHSNHLVSLENPNSDGSFQPFIIIILCFSFSPEFCLCPTRGHCCSRIRLQNLPPSMLGSTGRATQQPGASQQSQVIQVLHSGFLEVFY